MTCNYYSSVATLTTVKATPSLSYTSHVAGTSKQPTNNSNSPPQSPDCSIPLQGHTLCLAVSCPDLLRALSQSRYRLPPPSPTPSFLRVLPSPSLEHKRSVPRGREGRGRGSARAGAREVVPDAAGKLWTRKVGGKARACLGSLSLSLSLSFNDDCTVTVIVNG